MPSVIDYVIVGGGCAGTYCAWRLSTAYPKSTVQLYEATSRIGGRLLTLKLSSAGTRIELGGMRYATNQVLINHLIPALGLEHKTFNYPTQLLYLRDRRFWSGAAPPYSLSSEESPRDPVQLVQFAIARALEKIELSSSTPPTDRSQLERKLRGFVGNPDAVKFSALKASEWDSLKKHAKVGGVHLWEIGFWNLIHSFLSSEGYFFAHDGLGYESILANWNAAEAIPWFLRDFESVEQRTIIGGMEKLPKRLQYHFLSQSNGTTLLKFRLHKIELPSKKNNPTILTFKDVDTGTQETVVYAHNVILALPKGALEKLDFVGLSEGHVKRFRKDLELVRGNPLFKLFLAYKEPWWERHHGRCLAPGRAATDLPIRQVYYYEGDETDTTEPRLALLMASYGDGRYVDFWKPVMRKEKQPFYRRDVELSLEDIDALNALGASERMVNKAHRQIIKLHVDSTADIREVPDPCLGLVMNWSRESFHGAGWHTWEPGSMPWIVRQRIKQPFREANIYICGEAFSCEQGWVEGALRSAELVLKSLGITAPTWVPGEAYPKANFEDHRQYVEWNPSEQN